MAKFFNQLLSGKDKRRKTTKAPSSKMWFLTPKTYQNTETTIKTGNADGHVETTLSQAFCDSCGYPEHTAKKGSERKKQFMRWTTSSRLAVKKLITLHTLNSRETAKLSNSKHYTKNNSLIIFSPDTNWWTRTQTKETLILNIDESQLPTALEINAVLPLNGETLMYLPLKFENEVRRKVLIDKRTFANAMPADLYRRLKETSLTSPQDLPQATFLNVKVASGRNAKVLGQFYVKIKIIEDNCEYTFHKFPSMNRVVMGNPCFRQNSIEISPREYSLEQPEMTCEMKDVRTPRKKIPKQLHPVVMNQSSSDLSIKKVYRQNQMFGNSLKGTLEWLFHLKILKKLQNWDFHHQLWQLEKTIVPILAIILKDRAVTFTKIKQIFLSIGGKVNFWNWSRKSGAW